MITSFKIWATHEYISYSSELNIAFFGASATQQVAPRGYVSEFEKLHSGVVYQFGDGGMQIDNAGICFLDKIFVRKSTK